MCEEWKPQHCWWILVCDNVKEIYQVRTLHLWFLGPPTVSCLQCRSYLSANNPPTTVVLYLQEGPLPALVIVLRCTKCNLNYHPDIFWKHFWTLLLSNQWWNVPSKLYMKRSYDCCCWVTHAYNTFHNILHYVPWIFISMYSIIFYPGIMHGCLLSPGQRSTMKWIKGLPMLNELETSSINSHSCQDQVDDSIYTVI